MNRTFSALWLAWLLGGCAATPSAPPNAAPASAGSAPVAASSPSPASPAAKLPPSPASVPPPPASCAALVAAATACERSGSLSERLAAALEQSAALPRDRALSCVEQDAGLLAPALRALRAELSAECADALVEPFLETAAQLTPDDEAALVGLLLGAKLGRLVEAPPTLLPPFDKARFLEFFESTLKPWIVSQALSIGELSQRGAKLRGYGKAVAATEAGIADLRFVQAIRRVPLPEELAADAEVKNVYYSALDEALEPRKARGRDAALVGLRLYAELGALSDPRLARARQLLSELYGGSRVDALDRLILPDLPSVPGTSVEARLAVALPTYYALRLLSDVKEPGEPGLLRAFAARGLPATLRVRLERSPLSPEAQRLLAALEVRRGVVFFAASAFARAAELSAPLTADPDAALIAGVASALQGAPKDAAALMLSGPRLAGPLGSLDRLTALAAQKGPQAAAAEFDAALIRSLTPPENDPAFWTALSKSFARAAKGLRSPAKQALARDLSEGARKTAESVRRP